MSMDSKAEFDFMKFHSWGTLLRKSADGRFSPFPGTDLSHGFRDGDAKGGVTVQDRNAHLNLSDLAVKVARHQPLAQQFYAMHLRLDAASAVVSAPVSPESPAQIF